MAQEWWRNEAASHGFLVAPLALYLMRRRWHEAAVSATTFRPALGLVLAGLLLYPVGVVSGVDFLPEVSLVVTLGGLLLYLLGPEACRGLAFPYAFLWFAIPWPDTLVELISFPMQLFSAKFAAMLAGLFGLPVAREGVDIHLGAYTFSVGAPCSGMKSLVALLALAALIAHLMEGPRWKRGLLFLAGFPLAAVANVCRIVCILAIARVWGVKAAEGFFHGFSGVVVFVCAVGGLMLAARWFGLRYATPKGRPARTQADTAASPQPVAAASSSPALTTMVAPATLAALTLALVFVLQREPAHAVQGADFTRVPTRLRGWGSTPAGPLDRQSQEMLRPDAFFHRVYTSADRYQVDVTVVFGHEKDTFHSPGTCLTGGGWAIEDKGRAQVLATSDREATSANRFVLQKDGERMIVLYWYASYRRTDTNWVAFQYHLLRNRLTGRPSSGALMRFAVPVRDSDDVAAHAAADLAAQLAPSLHHAMGLR